VDTTYWIEVRDQQQKKKKIKEKVNERKKCRVASPSSPAPALETGDEGDAVNDPYRTATIILGCVTGLCVIAIVLLACLMGKTKTILQRRVPKDFP
jgi:hypothetical protein